MPKIHAHLSHILASMPQAVFVKDAESRFVMMNAACEALWGVRFEEVKGTNGSGQVPPQQLDQYHQRDRLAFETGAVITDEEACSPTGLNETRWLLIHKRAVYHGDGRPYLLIGSCTDITERKRKEAALENALQQTRAVAGHQLSAVESRHRRLALDTQDNLAQNLMALKLDIAMLHARTGDQQPLLHERAAQALATLNASINSVRDIINELHPATLELGLSAAIEWQLQQIERRHGRPCRLLVQNDSATLGSQQRSALFHIVQTGLGCLSPHAGALSVEYSLRSDRLAINLCSDRPLGAQDAETALALNGMRERLAALGGTLHLSDQALHITVPGPF